MARRKLFSLVTKAEGNHPFPCRTRKLSPPAPMVLPFGGRVGRCQAIFMSFGHKNSLGTPAAYRRRYRGTQRARRANASEPEGGYFYVRKVDAARRGAFFYFKPYS